MLALVSPGVVAEQRLSCPGTATLLLACFLRLGQAHVVFSLLFFICCFLGPEVGQNAAFPDSASGCFQQADSWDNFPITCALMQIGAASPEGVRLPGEGAAFKEDF